MLTTNCSSSSIPTADVDVSSEGGGRFQHVIVMRHGDRIDNFEPMWTANAERPWDPPLVEAGRVRAFCTGRKIREGHVGFPIQRVFVSPFLLCIQTANEAVVALCAVDGDGNGGDEIDRACSDGVNFEPSKIKVSIEYGLCEMLNRETIRMPPKDGNWGFNTPELESMLPTGTVDCFVERFYKEEHMHIVNARLTLLFEGEGTSNHSLLTLLPRLLNPIGPSLGRDFIGFNM